MGGTPLPIRCTNCHDKQLKCEVHPHTKGSCYHCIVNGLQCLFPPPISILVGHEHASPPGTTALLSFQRNCVHCTKSHQRCVFNADSPSQCKRCNKLQLTCSFKLSSQGRRNDLIAPTSNANDPNGIPANADESVQYHHRNDGDSCHGRVGTVHVDDSGISRRDNCIASTDANHPNGIPANADDSVEYHHRNDGDGCHGRIGTVHVDDSCVCGECSCRPPSWVHVFAKSNKPSSIRTQAASIAYIYQPLHKKARHHRNRRSKKKLRKQQKLLTEIIVPQYIQQNLLSAPDIAHEIVVVDGGDDGNPAIRPPDGVNWHCLSVIGGNHLHIQDETDPNRGLTFSRVDNALPFIRLPRQQSLELYCQMSKTEIVCALEECEKMKKTSVKRSDNKRIFGDYGQPVMYTCVGVQVSRNSPEVLNCNAFMENLPEHHWSALTKLMRHAEHCYEFISDTQVISHMFHARQVVSFKTMTMPYSSQASMLKYYGAFAFGRNVFLRCHTDSDFTMSMVQIHLKGTGEYALDDAVVAYFCFPTLGVAVPLRPGDFLLFNPLIPHCVSSRCRQNDDIISIAMYLKTAVVGMNNNQLPVSSNQSSLAERYHFATDN
jgi:hypothetical protein